jgi:hypothetical protein
MSKYPTGYTFFSHSEDSLFLIMIPSNGKLSKFHSLLLTGLENLCLEYEPRVFFDSFCESFLRQLWPSAVHVSEKLEKNIEAKVVLSNVGHLAHVH